MTYLDDLRAREKARKDSRTWAAAAAGQSGLPLQMLPVRQSGTEQPLILAGSPNQGGPGGISVGETVTLVAAGVTTPGTVGWDGRVRGEGFRVELPNPLAGRFGYYDFHVQVVSNDGPIRDLTISATGAETVTTDPTPFCTEWRGTLAHVLATLGNPLTIDLGWVGSADVDVTLTVGLIEPLTEKAGANVLQLFIDDELIDQVGGLTQPSFSTATLIVGQASGSPSQATSQYYDDLVVARNGNPANLLGNPGFESDVGAYVTTTSAVPNSFGNWRARRLLAGSTLGRDGAPVRSGDWSGVAAPPAGTNRVAYFYQDLSVVSGDLLDVSSWVRPVTLSSAAPQTMFVYLDWDRTLGANRGRFGAEFLSDRTNYFGFGAQGTGPAIPLNEWTNVRVVVGIDE